MSSDPKIVVVLPHLALPVGCTPIERLSQLLREEPAAVRERRQFVAARTVACANANALQSGSDMVVQEPSELGFDRAAVDPLNLGVSDVTVVQIIARDGMRRVDVARLRRQLAARQ